MSTRLPYDPATTVRFAHGTSANERDAEPSVDEQEERLHRRRRVRPKGIAISDGSCTATADPIRTAA